MARSRTVDLTGQVFGRLTVVHEVDRRPEIGRFWLCQCSCGNTPTVRQRHLSSGNTKSCGCLSLEVIQTRRYIPIAKNAVVITHGGVTLPVAQWASRTGIPVRALRERVRKKWPPERMFEAPRKKR